MTVPRRVRSFEANFVRKLAGSVGGTSNSGLDTNIFCDLRWTHGTAGIVERVSQAAGFDFSSGMPAPQESAALGEALAGLDQVLLILVGLDVSPEVVSSTIGLWLESSSSLRVLVTAPALLGIEGEAEYRLPEGEETSVTAAAEDWESLTSGLQDVVRSLCVFRGSFSLEAATVVAELDGPDAMEDVLASLADRSLLAWVGEPSAGGLQRRATLREDLQALAENLGGKAGLLGGAFARHRDYFSGGHGCSGSDRSEHDAALSWPLADRDNLLAVYERLANSDPEAGAEAVLCVAQTMLGQGPFVASAERLDSVIETLPGGHSALLMARLLLARGVARTMGPQADSGIRDLETARDWAAGEGQGPLEVAALEQLGLEALRAGHLKEAEGFLRGATERAAADGWSEVASRTLCSVGVVLEAGGQFDSAETAFLGALGHVEEGESGPEQIRSRSKLGAHYYFLNRWEEAEGHLRWSFDAAEQAGERFLAACSGYNLGRLSLNLGRLEEADEVLHRALAYFGSVGNRASEAYVRIELGVLHLEREELGLAREQLIAAVEQLARAPHTLVRCYAQLTLAQVALAADRLAEARSWHEHCLGATVRLNHRPLEGLVHCVGAGIEFVAGSRELCVAARDRAAELLADSSWAEGLGLFALAEAFAGGDLDMTNIQTQARARASLPLLGGGATQRFAPSAAYLSGPRVLPSSLAVGRERLRMEGEGRWFEVGEQERVDLSRKRTLRPLLRALVDASRLHPGEAMSVDAVFSSVWGGELCLPDARKNRVYVAVAALRKMGLSEVILTRGDGYLLLPELEIDVVGSQAGA